MTQSPVSTITYCFCEARAQITQHRNCHHVISIQCMHQSERKSKRNHHYQFVNQATSPDSTTRDSGT
eukprot:UN12720